jgi:hypothetical protein
VITEKVYPPFPPEAVKLIVPPVERSAETGLMVSPPLTPSSLKKEKSLQPARESRIKPATAAAAAGFRKCFLDRIVIVFISSGSYLYRRIVVRTDGLKPMIGLGCSQYTS